MRKLGEIYQSVRELKNVSYAEAKHLLSELEKTQETMLQLGDEFRLTRISMNKMIKDIKEVLPVLELMRNPKFHEGVNNFLKKLN